VAGIAGEHLVVADLLLAGYRAIKTEQHCPYDVVVELERQLIRIQVKSARAPRRSETNQHQPAYIWSVKRAGKRGQRRYGPDEFDLIACVALDRRLVAYVPEALAQQHVQFRVPGWVPPDMDHRGRRWPWATGREFCEFSFEKAVTQL
jgi:hypothetical protein